MATEACRCVVLDATTKGGGTDPRSCPEHAYEAGRRHERSIYVEERTRLIREQDRALLAMMNERDEWRCVASDDGDSERKAVVAWLRGQRSEHGTEIDVFLSTAADRLENGEHVKASGT